MVEGDELKFVYPQSGFDPLQFENLNFNFFFIQPMDNSNYDENKIMSEKPAFILVDVDIHNPEIYESYKQQVVPIVKAFGGEYIARPVRMRSSTTPSSHVLSS